MCPPTSLKLSSLLPNISAYLSAWLQIYLYLLISNLKSSYLRHPLPSCFQKHNLNVTGQFSHNINTTDQALTFSCFSLETMRAKDNRVQSPAQVLQATLPKTSTFPLPHVPTMRINVMMQVRAINRQRH